MGRKNQFDNCSIDSNRVADDEESMLPPQKSFLSREGTERKEVMETALKSAHEPVVAVDRSNLSIGGDSGTEADVDESNGGSFTNENLDDASRSSAVFSLAKSGNVGSFSDNTVGTQYREVLCGSSQERNEKSGDVAYFSDNTVGTQYLEAAYGYSQERNEKSGDVAYFSDNTVGTQYPEAAYGYSQERNEKSGDVAYFSDNTVGMQYPEAAYGSSQEQHESKKLACESSEKREPSEHDEHASSDRLSQPVSDPTKIGGHLVFSGDSRNHSLPYLYDSTPSSHSYPSHKKDSRKANKHSKQAADNHNYVIQRAAAASCKNLNAGAKVSVQEEIIGVVDKNVMAMPLVEKHKEDCSIEGSPSDEGNDCSKSSIVAGCSTAASDKITPTESSDSGFDSHGSDQESVSSGDITDTDSVVVSCSEAAADSGVFESQPEDGAKTQNREEEKKETQSVKEEIKKKMKMQPSPLAEQATKITTETCKQNPVSSGNPGKSQPGGNLRRKTKRRSKRRGGEKNCSPTLSTAQVQPLPTPPPVDRSNEGADTSEDEEGRVFHDNAARKRKARRRRSATSDTASLVTDLTSRNRYGRRRGDDSNGDRGNGRAEHRTRKDSGLLPAVGPSRTSQAAGLTSSGSGGSDDNEDEGQHPRRHLPDDGRDPPDEVLYGNADDVRAFYLSIVERMSTRLPNRTQGIIFEDARSLLQVRGGHYDRQPEGGGGDRAGVLRGQWVVCRLLGFGSSGVCTLCRDIVSGHFFCVKQIFWPHFRLEEVLAMLRLSDGLAFMRVYGLLAEGGNFLIMMRYANGGESLTECLRRAGPMTELRALGFLRGLVCAIRLSTGRGVIHNDISANNVLVLGDGNGVVVIDLGAAEVLAAGQISVNNGRFVGTIANASPERARFEAYSYSSDVWSLGCVLYQALTGRELLRDKFGANYQPESAMYALGSVTDTTLFLQDVDLSRFHARTRLILMSCWQAEPWSRPSLSELQSLINAAIIELAAAGQPLVCLPSQEDVSPPPLQPPELADGGIWQRVAEETEDLPTMTDAQAAAVVTQDEHLLQQAAANCNWQLHSSSSTEAANTECPDDSSPNWLQTTAEAEAGGGGGGGGGGAGFALADLAQLRLRLTGEPREPAYELKWESKDMKMVSIDSSASDSKREAEEELARKSINSLSSNSSLQQWSRSSHHSSSPRRSQAELMHEMHRDVSHMLGNSLGFHTNSSSNSSLHRLRSSLSASSNHDVRRSVDRQSSKQDTLPKPREYLVYFWYGLQFVATVTLAPTTVNERNVSLLEVVEAAKVKIKEVAETDQFTCYLSNARQSVDAQLPTDRWPINIDIRVARDHDPAHSVFR